MPLERSFFDQYSVFCVFGSVFGCVVVPLIAQSIESVILSAILISITANHLTRRNSSSNEKSYDRTLEKRSFHLSKKKKKSNGNSSNSNYSNAPSATSITSSSSHAINNHHQDNNSAEDVNLNEDKDEHLSEEQDEILNAMIIQHDERRRRKMKKKDKPKRKDPGKEVKMKTDHNRDVPGQNYSDSSKSSGNYSDRSDQSHSSRSSKLDQTNLNTSILHNKILHTNSRNQSNDNKLNNVEKVNSHDSKTAPKANHPHRISKIETVGNSSSGSYGNAVANKFSPATSRTKLDGEKSPLTPSVSKITYSQCVKGRKGKQLSPYAPEFFPAKSVKSPTIRLGQKKQYDHKRLLSSGDSCSLLPLQCMMQQPLPVTVDRYHNLETISPKCGTNLDQFHSKHTNYTDSNMVNVCKSHLDFSDDYSIGSLLQDRNSNDSSSYYSLFGDNHLNHLLDTTVLKLSNKS